MRHRIQTSLGSLLLVLLPAGDTPMSRGAPPGAVVGFHPALAVTATYPGASAQVVADTVAAPIEQEVTASSTLARLVSRCTDDGRYTLLLSFAPGTDLNMAQVLVQNRVALAQPAL